MFTHCVPGRVLFCLVLNTRPERSNDGEDGGGTVSPGVVHAFNRRSKTIVGFGNVIQDFKGCYDPAKDGDEDDQDPASEVGRPPSRVSLRVA